MIRFGPAGSPDSFAAMGYKTTLQMPEYLEKMGLSAFEYQCGRGVRISRAAAEQLGAAAREKGIALSIHAPYYISLSSAEEQKREKSIDYILQTARAADAMGARRIVVHSGSCGGMSREEALALAKDTMRKALSALDAEKLGHVHICPETMGKLGQLGTLEEVLELCRLDKRLIPCIDFGHLNARTFGSLTKEGGYEEVLDTMDKALGKERLTRFHAHFSKIEYTRNGGEKLHLTFADTKYGPEFEPLAKLLAQRGLSPHIICESAGTQAEDAAIMRDLYHRALAQLP